MQLENYKQFPQEIPIIVEDGLFLYPFMITPVFLSNDDVIDAANYAIENNLPILICPAKKGDDKLFYPAGVIGSIMRKVVLPDGRIKLLFQGLERGKIIGEEKSNPFRATVDIISNDPYNETHITAMLDTLKEHVRILSSVGSFFPADLLITIDESTDPIRVIDLVASTIKLDKDKSYRIFIEQNIEYRLLLLIEYVIEQIENSKLQKEIKNKVHGKIDKVNREYFLREQLKEIKKELGEDIARDEEIEEFRKKLNSKKLKMPKSAYSEIKKQIDRLSRMHPDSGDANLIQTYLEWSLELPFGKYSKTKLDINIVQKRLNKDHFSLKKPKERIVEFFAIKELLALRGIEDKESKGTILCFVGPPGVGKTSLANSIATALKRELVRVALGGLEDVNELRGHRRTYIGAMPGRIVQGLIDAKTMNPIMVLDEIDKVGRNMRGDPTSALLEILDPEQNDNFRDYYLNFDIDLSQVVFIATANDLSTIPTPLRDRLEIIYITSYTPQEKLEIAKRYLIPQELKKHGLKKYEFKLTPAALRDLIEKHTREAGVRNLRRKLATLMRKVGYELLSDSSKNSVNINQSNLKRYADKEVFNIEEVNKKGEIGLVNGLAWTSVGGDVLKLEAIKIKGKGLLTLTGSLGDVMKESARIAFSVIKTLIDNKKIEIPKELLAQTAAEKEKDIKSLPNGVYNNFDIHIHVPEGATPKDGPSAGIAMASVIASILSQIPARGDVAMTGELTLSGKVLPIGGLKEKLIAAHKAKIKMVLIPRKNYEQDLDEIPDEVKKTMDIVPVDKVEDVLNKIL